MVLTTYRTLGVWTLVFLCAAKSALATGIVDCTCEVKRARPFLLHVHEGVETSGPPDHVVSPLTWIRTGPAISADDIGQKSWGRMLIADMGAGFDTLDVNGLSFEKKWPSGPGALRLALMGVWRLCFTFPYPGVLPVGVLLAWWWRRSKRRRERIKWTPTEGV